MKKTILRLVIILCVLMFTSDNRAKASELNTKNETNMETKTEFVVNHYRYQILTEATEKNAGTVAYVGTDGSCEELILPSIVTYKGMTYQLTKLTLKNTNMEEIKTLVVPDSMIEIMDNGWYFGSSIKNITFYCESSVVGQLSYITTGQNATDLIFYVPQEQQNQYQNLLSDIVEMEFTYGSDLFERTYQGARVAAIGEEDVIPLRFVYKDLYYEVISEEEHTVKLIGGGLSINESEENIKKGYFTLPENVYYKDIKFTLTSLGKFSLSDVRTVIRMPNSITDIENYVFDDSIPAIYFSNAITSLPEDMFCGEDNPGIVYIDLPDALNTIPNRAFYDCLDLKAVVLPASVKTLGAEVFSSKLTSLYLLGEAPTTLKKALSNVKKTTIYTKSTELSACKKLMKKQINAGKVAVKKCDYNLASKLTLSQSKLKMLSSGNSSKSITATITKKSADHKLVWTSNTWGFARSSNGKVRNVQGGSIYSYSRIYVFDILSGKFASAKLTE